MEDTSQRNVFSAFKQSYSNVRSCLINSNIASISIFLLTRMSLVTRPLRVFIREHNIHNYGGTKTATKDLKTDLDNYAVLTLAIKMLVL